MKIPVYVSCPSVINARQYLSLDMILKALRKHGLEPNSIGRSDYPSQLPLQEVYSLARRCCGGIVLGFEQFRTSTGVFKKGTREERNISNHISFPTPWNHLEAGILYSLQLPLLILREAHIQGGIFDAGVTDVFIHNIPDPKSSKESVDIFHQVVAHWTARVRELYYKSTAFDENAVLSPIPGLGRNATASSLNMTHREKNVLSDSVISDDDCRVFLSYARPDEEKVTTLYQQLLQVGVKPWMDRFDIMPGEVWQPLIEKAIKSSDFFLACISSNSASRRGVLQKELKNALEVWEKMLGDDIYFIPVRLEQCEVPETISRFQWVDLFGKNGFKRLIDAIKEGIERRKEK
jgi:hypothetical protein